jgi:hypothetical protein
VDATQLCEEDLDEVLTKAAELNVPVLFRRYASRFGPIGRKNCTTDIISYLIHQRQWKRPPPTCQVQGRRETKFQWDTLIKYFKTHPDLRTKIINMLDNPVECYPTLNEAFNSPEFIVQRDVIEFALGIPPDADKVRDGFKFPSLRRWLLAGAKYAVAGFHMDGMGVWTGVQQQKEAEPQTGATQPQTGATQPQTGATQPQTGSKVWFWVEKNDENVDHLEKEGQFHSVSKFTKIFAVRPEVGDLLVINPETIHGVVTDDDSIWLGVHFLLRETLGRSVYSAMREYKSKNLTNDKRQDGQNFYSRLLKVIPLGRRY